MDKRSWIMHATGLRRAHTSLLPSALSVLLLVAAVRGESLRCNASSADQASLARWTAATGLTFSRDSHAAAVFQDKIWVVGGVSTSYYTKRLEQTTTRSDVVFTTDGAKWTEVLEEAPFRRRFGHSLTAFTDGSDGQERLVLLGGFSPEPAIDVWTSIDGATWLEVLKPSPWSGRGYHCSVVFNSQLWVMGGSPLNNDVWSASSVLNGDWKQQANVPWAPRAAHACAAHKVMANATLGESTIEEFVFLMGGWDESTMQDVWRMDSSGAWIQLTSTAPWSKRAWHSLVSFDSRTNGDVELGPRMWLIGGGIIGSGVLKMHPYWDVWYSRNGSEWVEASSDSSGVSTADWSMITTREKQTCMGKWGQSVVSFFRPVKRSYYCSASCKNEANTTSLANQIVPVCDPAKALPDPPVQKTVLLKSSNSLVSRTLYPDGCGLCYGSASERYVNSTRVPALFLVAGNVGSQKVKDVFYSNDAMLCEQNGVICSNHGTCTLGGTCLCVAGKTGQFCEQDSSFTVVDTTNCFPPTARVVLRDGSRRAMGDVAVGDHVLTVDATTGQPTYAAVYFLPHDPTDTRMFSFVRVHHALLSVLDSSQLNPVTAVLDVTPLHLLYIVAPECKARVLAAGALPAASASASAFDCLAQVSARELRVGDLLVRADAASPRLALSRVASLGAVRLPGAVTLYTTTGSLVVDGVLCSNFADLYPRLGRRRDAVAWALFAPHRLIFTALPFPATARLLRELMDAVVLPLLARLWPRHGGRSATS